MKPISQRTTRLASVLAVTALTAATVPAVAQEAEPSFTPEDMAKGEAFVEFVANAEAWLPTVNHIDPESLPTTFPFEEILEHAAVDVMIGDAGPYKFMVDTGASTLVGEAIAEEHGGEVIIETLNQAGGGSFFFTPLQQYPPFGVGGALTITEATAGTPWHAGGDFDCFAPDGILGATSMANAVWQIDYGNGEITVAASADQLEHVEDAIAVPFFLKEGISPSPRVEVGLAGETLEAIVDTGGGLSVAITPESLANLGIEIPEGAPSVANISFGAAGAFANPVAFAQLPLTFGGTEIDTAVIVGNDLSPGADINIGHSFLKNFVVTFDWSTNTMYLDPLADDGTIPSWSEGEQRGVGVALAGDIIMVTSVADGSAANEAGLALGEEVTMINGESIDGLTIEQYCADIAGQTHETITTESGTYDAGPVEGFFDSLDG